MNHLTPDTTSLFNPPAVSAPAQTVRIEFDGGTPCNIPRLGYGIGYGSYRIDAQPIVRIDHKRPMSANAAEIFTLISAIQDLAGQMSHEHGKGRMMRENVRLEIHGDSQIALKWAQGTTPRGRPAKLAKGTSEEFRNAIQSLRDVLKGFRGVETHWRGRAASVALFGH